MVLIGLLLLALIFVVVGVLLASAGWLIASLVVSVAAAALLLRSHLQTRQQRGSIARAASSDPAQAAPANAPEPSAVRDEATTETHSAAGQATVPPDTQVWVADGYPEYHVEGCGELAGLAAEAVPYEQAVEDGFQPCVVCNPDRVPLPAAVATAADGARAEVWVVDGYPNYHRAGCSELSGLSAEAIPYEQAVEDGFAACAVCRPEGGTEAPAKPTAETQAQPEPQAGDAEH